MSDSEPSTASDTRAAATPERSVSPAEQTLSAEARQAMRAESRRWWIKLILQPLMLLACGTILIVGLGLAQRWGFITAGDTRGLSHATDAGSGTRYICPMMCTPPQAEPGRCPVCAMELVPATSSRGGTDSRSIQIDPAARRVADIRTVAVTSTPMTRTIRAIGELHYDEGTLKTISAYVAGRLDRLYADFTGVVVKKGDQLALVYSPLLYSGQVELLLARKSRDESRSSTRARVVQSGGDLYASARERLGLLGMTEMQIAHLEESGKANSQMHLFAPISGTVIEKMAVEGQYVKEGDAIYKLADLSTVWLMLRLFPEDAAAIRYGQKVQAEVQSLPHRQFAGRIAFIDPQVDSRTRTVGVRVVIPNDEGLLRIGDYAKATIDLPLSDVTQTLVYDPELANKWISPRHPHIVSNAAGTCPICGVDLVPAAQFGFTDDASAISQALVVPRDAVLMAGNNSVLYVETEPGRFELRRVVLGPSCGDQIVIRSGVQLGEQVASRGNFLIDSQMQLAGNPSLIDPQRLERPLDEAMSAEMIAALSGLSAEDRALVQLQQNCPVTDSPLGAMGVPEKVDVNGTVVFICCDGCREELLSEPEKYLAKLRVRQSTTPSDAGSLPTPQPMDLPPMGTPRLIEMEGSAPAVVSEESIDATSTESTKRAAATSEEEVR